MTDNDIIKALECCTRSGCSDNETKDCPLKPFEDCSIRLASNALDLINRQQKEIERLQKLYELAVAEREANVKGFTEVLETAKSEAIKEFAERLEANSVYYYVTRKMEIDSLDFYYILAEMTEDV